MSSSEDPKVARLPMHQLDLLQRAIGRQLIEIERMFAISARDFAQRGAPPGEYFARASGATRLSFSGGEHHTLAVWPSQLSVIVSAAQLADDPLAERVLLSTIQPAPAWRAAVLGHAIDDVRIYEYLEPDVDSLEARQSAVSYLFDSGVELFYCTYLHGRMDGDELLLADEVQRQHVARCLSLRDRSVRG
jgi:hypothetical protein